MIQKNHLKSTSFKYICQEEDNMKLAVDVLALNSSYSKSLIKKLMNAGAVFQTVNKKRSRIRKAKKTVRKGDFLECYFDPKIDLDQCFDFDLLFETKNYGIYHKPDGALTEGTNYGDKVSLYRYLETQKKKAYIVNRLDREVEGLIMIAYDSKAQNILQEMWREKVTKKYQAIVLGDLEGSGEFNFPINDKFSQTQFYSCKNFNNKSYLDLTLSTERKHQARIHLDKAGHPVIGDPLYGKKNKNDLKDGIQLISYLIKFKDPFTDIGVKVLLPQERLLF